MRQSGRNILYNDDWGLLGFMREKNDLYHLWTVAELATAMKDDPTIIAYRLRKLQRAG